MHIELLKPHTHAGKRLAVGERLEVNDTSARWLIAQGVAKAVTASAATTDSKPNRRDTASGTTTSQGD